MTVQDADRVKINTAGSLYELMLACSDAIFDGIEFSDTERKSICDRFLKGVSPHETVRRFHDSLNAPKAENGDSREMYPLFYVPPYHDSGAKYRTVTGQLPKTHILSANAYELEILRILYLVAPESALVRHMLERTQRRLDTTCFGKFCSGGECYDTGAAVLRFYCTAFPNYQMRQHRLFDGLYRCHGEAPRSIGTDLYILTAINEAKNLPMPQVAEFTDVLVDRLITTSPKNERSVYYTMQLLKKTAPDRVAAKRKSLIISGAYVTQLKII